MKNGKGYAAVQTAITVGYSISACGIVSKNGKKIKCRKDRNGYSIFTLNSRPILVHQLQAFTLFGSKVLEFSAIRHLNGDKDNNSISNIALGSNSDNQLDIPKNVRLNSSKAASAKRRRFTEDELTNIKRDRLNGMSYKQLCTKYNTSKGTLSYMFNKSNYY